MINVIAVVTTIPGKRAEVLEHFKANVPNVQTEDGCIEYSAVVDVEDGPGFQTKYGPDSFVVIEKWRDVDALTAHARAPHMASYGAAIKTMLVSRAIHVLQGV